MAGAQGLCESHAQPCLEKAAIRGGFLKEESFVQEGEVGQAEEVEDTIGRRNGWNGWTLKRPFFPRSSYPQPTQGFLSIHCSP